MPCESKLYDKSNTKKGGCNLAYITESFLYFYEWHNIT